MPAYDSVIGARLVAGDAAAARQLELAGSNDEDLSTGDRLRELANLAAIPGTHAELVIEGEEGDRYLVVVADGEVDTFPITDSRAADHDEPAQGTPYAHARTKVPADEVLEILAHEEAERIADDEIRFPHLANDLDEVIAKLAKIGPMLDGGVILLVDIADRRYDVELAYGAVTVTPLHPRCAHLDRVLAIVPELAASEAARTIPFDAAVKRSPAPKLDPARPLTTGSARQRLDAFSAYTDWRTRKKPDLAPLIAAAQDPANHEHRYDELRRQIYHFLAKYDVPEVCALWLWALREETEDVAGTVTYIGWRLDLVIAALPAELAAAKARGDTRTAARIAKLQTEAR